MNVPYDDYDPYFDELDDEDAVDDPEEGTATRPDDRARSFPPFPAGARGGRRFARTWWGNAWIESMETAAIDPEQLGRGRRYAHAGHVGTITVSPGRIAAGVHDGDFEQPYRTSVRLSVLGDHGWARFLDQVASKAGHIAALLDGEMPHELVAAADDAGVRLLPGVGDLDPSCDCPDWNHPCKHAAALSYQVAWLLDADPFVLLLMRGRDREELLTELRLRNPRPDGGERFTGVPAGTAYATAPAPLPALPAVAWTRPMALTPLLAEAGEDGPDPAGLSGIAADAAARARALLAGEAADPVGCPEPWADAVRLAAAADADPEVMSRLGAVGGRGDALARAVAAWRCGGPAGLQTLEEPWTPPPAVQARGRRALELAWSDAGHEGRPVVRPWRNRWTLDDRGVQLRYGRDGRWYPYRRQDSAWWPSGPPDGEADTAFAELLREPG